MKLAVPAALLIPVCLAAQPTPSAERASFYLVRSMLGGTDTVIAERSTRTASQLNGEFLVSGARTTYAATLAPNGLVTRLELHAYRPATDSVGTAATFTALGDSVVTQLGAAAPVHRPAAAGALIVVNPSMAFFEQMLIRAKAVAAGAPGGKVTIPLFIVGAPAVVPLVVTWIGADSATLDYAGASLRFALSPTGQLRGGSMPAQQLRIVRGGAVETLASERPDYSAPAGAPYTAEEVVVRTPAGIKLAGTLTIPRTRPGGRAPAVVTITGSGPEDRDEATTVLRGYRPFGELADTLGRRGIAVLRLDDRGVGGSETGPSNVTSSDFADDIRAGVAYLRTRPEIDGARVALVGHSEGGIIAPMVASADSALRAIVLMAATASPGRDIIRQQRYYVIDTMAHLTGAQRDTALARSVRSLDSMAAHTPWMKLFLDYDPSELARRVTTPVLILQGATDHQVPASEAEKLAAAFRAGGNRHVTVKLFPETNHLFVADPTGSFEYAKLPSLRVRPEVLAAIADWLAGEFK